MASLTVSIPEDVLRKARIRALERRTSVNAVVRDYVERYAGVGSAADAPTVRSSSASLVHVRPPGPPLT
jgi:hypothetical protein